MNSLKVVIILVLTFSLLGCGSVSNELAASRSTMAEPESAAKVGIPNETILQKASLKDADHSQSIAEAMDRKIISSAQLTLEVPTPLETQQKVSTIAVALGGFVVTSELKQSETRSADPAKQELSVMLVVRVPAAQFDSAINQILNTGGRIIDKKVTGQDVTEEFIDLEARAKTLKALEQQFLEIMKQATKVADAMEVQRQIAEVRTEIEKLEGRKRFLVNRASLSTISITLRTPTTIVVNSSGFGRSVREAIAGSVELATGIVLGVVRLVILLIPIAIFFGLPAFLLARYFLRRSKRLHLASELESPD